MSKEKVPYLKQCARCSKRREDENDDFCNEHRAIVNAENEKAAKFAAMRNCIDLAEQEEVSHATAVRLLASVVRDLVDFMEEQTP